MQPLISRDKNILIKNNRFSHYLGAFPPFYCKTSDKFLIPKRGRKFSTLPLVFFVMAVDIIYLWIKIHPIISSQTLMPQEYINFDSHVISRSIGCIFAWISFFQMDDLVHFTNVLFQMETHFEGMS